MAVQSCPQIALLIDTATDWGRRMIRGIGRYAQQHGGWDIWLEQRCQHAPGRLPPGWCGDGIIARVADRTMGRYLAEALARTAWEAYRCTASLHSWSRLTWLPDSVPIELRFRQSHLRKPSALKSKPCQDSNLVLPKGPYDA